jgi:hypothetical protein
MGLSQNLMTGQEMTLNPLVCKSLQAKDPVLHLRKIFNIHLAHDSERYFQIRLGLACLQNSFPPSRERGGGGGGGEGEREKNPVSIISQKGDSAMPPSQAIPQKCHSLREN